MPPVDRQDARRRFLELLEEWSAGRTRAVFPLSRLAEELGLDRREAAQAFEWLRNAGLVELAGGRPMVAITHAGLTAVERRDALAVAPPSGSVNVINIGPVEDSQIQQGTNESAQRSQ